MTVAGTVLFSVAIVGALIWQQRTLLLGYAWKIRPEYLLLSTVLYAIDLILVTWIWGDIVNSLGVRLPFKKHFAYYCIANIAKRLPGTIWYVAGRGQLYQKDDVSLKVISIASGIEFVVALLSSILLSIVFALHVLASYAISPWVLVLVFAAGGLLLHPTVFGWLLKKFNVEASGLAAGRVLIWFAGYLVAWGLTGVAIFAIANALAPLSAVHIPYITGCVSLLNLITSALFFAPTNLGVNEIGLGLLLGSVMPVAVAVILAVVVRILFTLYEICAALLCLAFSRKSSRQGKITADFLPRKGD